MSNEKGMRKTGRKNIDLPLHLKLELEQLIRLQRMAETKILLGKEITVIVIETN